MQEAGIPERTVRVYAARIEGGSEFPAPWFAVLVKRLYYAVAGVCAERSFQGTSFSNRNGITQATDES